MLETAPARCYLRDLTGFSVLLTFIQQDPDSEAGSTETEMSKVKYTVSKWWRQFILVNVIANFLCGCFIFLLARNKLGANWGGATSRGTQHWWTAVDPAGQKNILLKLEQKTLTLSYWMDSGLRRTQQHAAPPHSPLTPPEVFSGVFFLMNILLPLEAMHKTCTQGSCSAIYVYSSGCSLGLLFVWV